MRVTILGLVASMLAICVHGQPAADSLDLKIGQMIMVGIGDYTELSDRNPLVPELSSGKIGGVVLFEKNLAPKRTREQLQALTAKLQSKSRIPLFVSIDEEGGRVHRLKEKYGFFAQPSAESLGRKNDSMMTLAAYRQLAGLLAALGFNLNYAPDVDVAVNPKNTVIVTAGRSFSSNPAVVARQAVLCVQAHRESRVGTVLKHFPGHGSSAGDSHLGLVDVTKTWQPKELVPFQTLIRAGMCDAVMIAHIINAKWDPSRLPATLSRKVVTDLLRETMGFRGVVFTDDMQMKAIADHYGLEGCIRMAVQAGVDVLMFGNTLPGAKGGVSATSIHAIIRKMVDDKVITTQRIDESYRRIMSMKAKIS